MIPRLRWQTMSRLLPHRLRKIGAPPSGAFPIALFSLNRPHYLAEVLKSFAAKPGLAPKRLHLFQDGAVNAYSGRVAAEQKDIDTCIALFRRHFTPKPFVEMGFHQTELYDGPTPTAFACPTRAEIDHHVGQMAAIFAESSRTLGP